MRFKKRASKGRGRRVGRKLKGSSDTTIARSAGRLHPRFKPNDFIAAQNIGVMARNRKRARTGNSDTTTSKRNVGNQYYQHERRYIKQGRKLKPLAFVKSVVRMGNHSVFDVGHRDYTNFSSTTTNSLGLNRYSGAGNTFYPVYVWDLTNANFNASRVITLPACVRLYNDGSYWLWNPSVTMASDGTKTAGYQCNVPNGLKVADHNVNWDRSLMEWVSMQFNITGPTTRPCKVSFELCSLREQWVDPFLIIGVAGTTNDFLKHQKYWGREAAKLVENPIHKMADWQGTGQPYKVLSRRVMEFQPTSTTESDTRGHIQTLKWFKRVNKILTYKSLDQNYISNAQAQSTYEPAPLAANIPDQCSMVPRMRERLFMIVKATCWDLDTSAIPGNSTTNARIEWNITARHRVADTVNVVLPDP